MPKGFQKGHKINVGRKQSEEHRKNIAIAQTGRTFSEATKKKLSELKSGVNNPMYGKPSWNKGTVGVMKPNKTSFKKGNIGSKSPSWKGEEVGYFGIHNWLSKNYGRPGECVYCGCKNNKEGRSIIEWASIDGKHYRKLEQYIPLCRACHTIYDKKWKNRERDRQGRFR